MWATTIDVLQVSVDKFPFNNKTQRSSLLHEKSGNHIEHIK